ncbi:serine/threonine-protein kinase HipA [Homoserinimonas aerilata]|uniref:Serine/threonine-protein kinase HipA n=1 Tax=Homoserinimonas aerilata TaxID=1162970 RepID=A0A542YL57_9MICO|nr:HipA domain-containing protein [Homoserinimonas aerilata]TQL48829.1 serine/threonine-protein kinase HipA [Homoserinimonas aerilata]
MTVTSADAYKAGRLAARLRRTPGGIEFDYLDGYRVSGHPPLASTLPLNAPPRITAAGAVPPYFAGLLPEGRRLTALRQAVKTSADDELTLLTAVAGDTIGDVQVVEQGHAPTDAPTTSLPKSLDRIRFSELLGTNGTERRPTLAGVQDKVSAGMISLPVARSHEQFILKLNPPEHPHLVENEAFFLALAKRCGLPVSPFRMVSDADGTPGLLVTRFDRGPAGPLAVEDACQAADLWPADKYNLTMEEAAHTLMRLTSAPLVAARDILRQLVFAWLTGNGDLHAKNLSALSSPEGDRSISPAYDLPSTLFYGDTTLALTVGGRDTLSAARLRSFAEYLRLPARMTELAVSGLLTRTANLPDELRAAGLPFDRRTIDKAARQLAARHSSLEGSG